MTDQPIRVGVCGAAGRMGREVVKTVLNAPDMALVMAVDPGGSVGQDAALVAGGLDACGVPLTANLPESLVSAKPAVVVDFTAPHTVFDNARTVLSHGVHSVVGTTGLSEAAMSQLGEIAQAHRVAVLVAPNFAIGAVLLMKFAQEASRYFDHAEIIELHHNQKLDAPSGTALRTAHLMAQAQPRFGTTNVDDHETELLAGARGAKTEANLRIHSVRLPGLVAHQEVILGAQGQTLTLRHDSLDRTSFMPGVAQAIRAIGGRMGLIYGLENLL